MKSKRPVENDVDLKHQHRMEKILDHHPHKGMPQHGMIVKSRPHLLEKVRKPAMHG